MQFLKLILVIVIENSFGLFLLAAIFQDELLPRDAGGSLIAVGALVLGAVFTTLAKAYESPYKRLSDAVGQENLRKRIEYFLFFVIAVCWIIEMYIESYSIDYAPALLG